MRSRGLLLAGALAAAIGFAWPWLGSEHSVPLPIAKASSQGGHAYGFATLPALDEVERMGDIDPYPRRSRLRLLENGKALGPAHAVHAEIRSQGGGRFSHWGQGLVFSASDNTDPRANGREYAIAYVSPLPPSIGWLLLLVGAAMLLLAGRQAAYPAGGAGTAWASLRSSAATYPLQLILFLAIAGIAVTLGPDRSAWILITQPVEALHAANSMLGYSWIKDGAILHKQNYSSFLQLGIFAGADVTPDAYYRRPVYTFFATLLAGALGPATAMLTVNLLAWAAAVWLTHRFTRAYFEDDAAARWAALLAATGIGFVVHALDLSAHLLSFAFYMAGVVLVFESQAWKRRVDWRHHAAIGVFLALACLQSSTGIALVAGYFLVALRHNARYVVPVCIAAVAAQPLWDAILATVFLQRHGTPLPDLSAAEPGNLARALAAWGASPGGVAATFLRHLLSFAAFEMPLVVGLGALGLLRRLRDGSEARARFWFAVPFIVLPVVVAMVFASSTTARGHLIYGISLFFFAGTGAVLAALARRREGVFAPLAVLVVVSSIAWGTAHFGNVLGPAKAYFLGFENARDLFALSSVQAQSLTDAEPVPRLFGGSASLAAAGLSSSSAPAFAYPPDKSPWQAFATTALFIVLAVALLACLARIAWTGAVAALLLLFLLARAGGDATQPSVALFDIDQAIPVEAGKSVIYEVAMGSYLRRRLSAGVQAGGVLTIFPALYRGDAPPVIEVDGKPIRVTGGHEEGSWPLDSKDVLAAFQGSPGMLKVTIPAASAGYLAGWQARGLPGRRLLHAGGEHPSRVLPAVELRLMRDRRSRAPLLVAF